MTAGPTRRSFLAGVSALALAGVPAFARAEERVFDIATPMAPPEWALLQRQLLGLLPAQRHVREHPLREGLRHRRP